MDKLLSSFAQEVGLRYDEAANALYGFCGGYHVCLAPQGGNQNIFNVVFSVRRGGMVPGKEELKALTKSCKQISNCAILKNGVAVTAKPNGLSRKKTLANAKTAMEEAAAYFRQNGYEDCCQSCGHELPAATYRVHGAYLHLCSQCANEVSALNEQQQYQQTQKSENVIGGVVGAFLGSLLGVLVMVILDQLGYVAVLSGIVLAICTLKGYELLGGKIGKLGTILSVVIMVVMVYVGNRVTWSIEVVKELRDYLGLNFFESFRYLTEILELAGEEAQRSYLGSLAMQYLFAAIGAVPTILAAGKDRQLKYAVVRLGNNVEE